VTDTSGPEEESTSGGREVRVPIRLYKTVTVFSTLIAVGTVITGFLVLDVATQRASASLSEVNPLLAVLGLAFIAGGGAVYAFSTRFQAEEMGKDNGGEDRTSDNE